MKPTRHSQPVPNVKTRRSMIASATVFTVVGSFIVALGLGVIFVLVMMVKGDASVHDLLFPLLFWGYGAVI